MEAKAPIQRSRPALLSIGLCLALAACEGSLLEDGSALDSLSSLNPLPSLEKAVSGGWLFGDTAEVAPPAQPEPIYCYETLGVRDCHEAPIDDGGNRLVGFEGPAPRPHLPLATP